MWGIHLFNTILKCELEIEKGEWLFLFSITAGCYFVKLSSQRKINYLNQYISWNRATYINASFLLTLVAAAKWVGRCYFVIMEQFTIYQCGCRNNKRPNLVNWYHKTHTQTHTNKITRTTLWMFPDIYKSFLMWLRRITQLN